MFGTLGSDYNVLYFYNTEQGMILWIYNQLLDCYKGARSRYSSSSQSSRVSQLINFILSFSLRSHYILLLFERTLFTFSIFTTVIRNNHRKEWNGFKSVRKLYEMLFAGTYSNSLPLTGCWGRELVKQLRLLFLQ